MTNKIYILMEWMGEYDEYHTFPVLASLEKSLIEDYLEEIEELRSRKNLNEYLISNFGENFIVDKENFNEKAFGFHMKEILFKE